MSRTECVTLTVRSRDGLLRLLDSQREFILPPPPESPRSLCAISVDYLGIPNWDFIDTESADDLFEKMKAALRDNGVCGFTVRFYGEQFSVNFLDDAKRGCVATWTSVGTSDTPRLVASIPDPRQSVQTILQSVGHSIDYVERVCWEYGE
jgi:hypothetical protein